MAELTMGTLIKIILGVAVVAVVIGGLVIFFKDKVIGFFENLPGEEGVTAVLSLLN